MNEMGWHAFQQLSHTVLREVLGQTVESFLDGNDGGRDGAFAGRWSPDGSSNLEGAFVVQCKHTSKPGYNLSLSDLDDELEKASRLVEAGRCDVYVLMTNAGVSGASEETIVAALRARGVRDVLVLGSTWLNQIIAENSRLRRLVPRLYGLGDLTQILDERAYGQARAVLDAMRTDLAKLVLTGTYELAARALADHSFVVLIGAPSTGKTTIAAQLALGAADDFDCAVVKLDTIVDLQDRWNADDRQLFWLDDAFGSTRFDPALAQAWIRAIPSIKAALAHGSMFVLTSRGYVFQSARSSLKTGAFPLLNQAQVVVDVSDLTTDERCQILYNHLRLGPQPNSFLAALQPHLEFAADHSGFTPELARRVSDPIFTTKLAPGSEASVDDFFARPSDFLREVMSGLDNHGRAALGLIFINHNWLPSPIRLGGHDLDLVQRLDSTLGGITEALAALDGSLVRNIVKDGSQGWVFAHPTMVEAYADLLRNPELLHHLISGFPLDVLLTEISCDASGVGSWVQVPPAHYEAVLDRLDETVRDGEFVGTTGERSAQTWFLITRCDREFLGKWVARNPGRVWDLREPGLMLDADEDNRLVARLNEFGLYPEDLRANFAQGMIAYCVSGEDTGVLSNERLRSILSESEEAELHQQIREVLLNDMSGAIYMCAQGYSSEADPELVMEPLRDLVSRLPEEFPGDPEISAAAGILSDRIDVWVAEREWNNDGRDGPGAFAPGPEGDVPSAIVGERSVFDDLVQEREDGIET